MASTAVGYSQRRNTAVTPKRAERLREMENP